MTELMLALFIRYGLPYLLRKETLTAAEGMAVNLWYAARQLKIYSEYPGDKKDKSVAKGPSNSNLNQP